MSKPLKGFIAYSHKNTTEKDTLRAYLAVMKQQNKLVTWHDGDITGGDKARQEDILKEVADSDILLYLVSAWSLASENCNKELAEALRAEVIVIPIILESCDWLNHQLSDFQAFPDKGKPINKWQPETDGWQNVVEGIRKTIEEIPTDVQKGMLPEWIFQQGNFLMMLGQMDRAIEAYSYAITLNPNNVDAYLNRGVTYGEKGDSERAMADFNRAIELNPGDAAAYNNRGITHREMDEPVFSIEDFNKAIQLKPNYAVAYNNRGVTYGEKGDSERAMADFNKAIELNPNLADNYLNRGVAYGEKGDSERAMADFNRAIELNPDDAKAYISRGWAYYKKGEIDCAIKDYTNAIELKPDFVEAYGNRGIAYGENGNYDCAITDYSKVIELVPNDAKAYYNRGRAWLHLREREKARADLTIAKEKGIEKHGIQLPADVATILTPQQ